MTTTYTHSYWASQSLLGNASRTYLPNNVNEDSLSEWLKASYNANIDSNTDYLDLAASLEANNGFDPFNYANTYVTNLENNPMGNMKNELYTPSFFGIVFPGTSSKILDNDYYSYTTGGEYSSPYTITQLTPTVDLLHDGYAGYGNWSSPPDCKGFKSLEDYYLYQKIIAGTAPDCASVDYVDCPNYSNSTICGGSQTPQMNFTRITAGGTNSDYSQGIKFDSNGLIAVNDGNASSTLASQVAGDFNGIAISIDGETVTPTTFFGLPHLTQDDLVSAYKNISKELQGLKEYTMTNQEIIDMQNEIDTLNGPGVKQNYEKKIAEAQDNLKSVFAMQIHELLNTAPNTAQNDIFDQTELTKAGTAPKESTLPYIYKAVEAVSDQYDPLTNKYYYNGQWIAKGTAVSNITQELAPNLFSQDQYGKYDYLNNAFYQYVVGLKQDSSLEMVKSFAQAVPTWANSTNEIKKADSFDPGKYSTVEEKTTQKGPLDVLKELYGTQELIALYKQYNESQTKANSLTISLNVALQTSAEFDYRKALADIILSRITDPQARLELSSDINIVNNIKRGCSTGPDAQKKSTSVVPTFDGFYGDSKESKAKNSACALDPYEVTINGTKYIMGRDVNANGNIDDVSEILGINDSYDNPFTSLMSLDKNKDGVVSQSEMYNAGIILKAVDNNGKLTTSSYETSLINSIDLSALKKTQEGNIAGTFSVKLANGATAQGAQTFDDQAYFNTLFGKLVDLRPYQKASTTNATATTNQTSSNTTTAKTTTTADAATNTATTSKTATDAEVATQSTTSVTSTKHQNLLNQINTAYNALIIDDTSNIETIMNNVCWKHSISLTASQRIKIMDGIDPLLSAFEIENKIINEVSKLNLSA